MTCFTATQIRARRAHKQAVAILFRLRAPQAGSGRRGGGEGGRGCPTWGTMGAGGRKRRISRTTARVYVIWYSTSPVMVAAVEGRSRACSSRTCPRPPPRPRNQARFRTWRFCHSGCTQAGLTRWTAHGVRGRQPRLRESPVRAIRAVPKARHAVISGTRRGGGGGGGGAFWSMWGWSAMRATTHVRLAVEASWLAKRKSITCRRTTPPPLSPPTTAAAANTWAGRAGQFQVVRLDAAR